MIQILSFCMALLLAQWTGGWPWAWFQPDWVLLACLLWAIVPQKGLSLSIPWFLGLLMDVILQTPLGVHALGYTLVCFIAMQWRARFVFYAGIQQCFVILGLLFLSKSIEAISLWGVLQMPQTGLYWASILSSVTLWPVLYYIMRRYQKTPAF